MATKTFIGVVSVIENGKTIALYASNIKYCKNDNGLTPKDCLDFFMSLRDDVQKGERVVFVCYAFSYDLEFMFRDLPNGLKDKLFEVRNVRKEISDIEYDQELVFQELRSEEIDTHERAKLEHSINKLALADKREIEFEGYCVQLRAGKSLTITKNKKRFVLYDVYSFFRTDLAAAALKWLDRDNVSQVPFAQTALIADLMGELNEALQAKGVNLARYHGTGAVATWILNKGKAKDYYKNYRYKRLMSRGFDFAALQSYYAGRVEQLKIGKFEGPIYIYDINSAYAYAITLLPIFLNKMKLVENYTNNPFSLWHCKYDLTSADPYIGFLPFRRKGTNETSYKLKGSGFYWQPEIEYLRQRFPDCIQIGRGYSLPFYEIAPFTQAIKDIYQMRLDAKASGEPIADVLKLALSSIYGKFCQRNNKGFYINRAYAGFITSVVRSQLMRAVEGNEANVICFLTDAIHTTAPLNVPISNELGAFKEKKYANGLYLDNGVYQLQRYDGTVKEATRGQRTFDFEAVKNKFFNTQSYSATIEFLVCYGLYANAPAHYDYLSVKQENKHIEPLETEIREFERKAANGVFDSKVISRGMISESGMYLQNDLGTANLNLEMMVSGRV